MEEKGKCFSGCDRGQRKKSDFYETPYSITQQLLDVHNFQYSEVLEPACGNGAMSKILKKKFKHVEEFDINTGKNFLEYNGETDNIITNPPFSLAHEFILKAKEVTRYKIAMLLPLSYAHGKKRYDEIWTDKNFRLHKIYVFTRYPMLGYPIREDGKYRTGMMVYSWFVWDRQYTGFPIIDWIDNNKYVLGKK